MSKPIAGALLFILAGCLSAVARDLQPDALMSPCPVAQEPMGARGFNGSINFTSAEKARHRTEMNELLQRSSACIEDKLAYDREFSARPGNYGLSPFIGSEFYYKPRHEKRQILRELTGERDTAKLDSLSRRLVPTSCVGLAVRCLKEAFPYQRPTPSLG
jgi:hypothetical protein